jgi:hypothetical protein
MLMADLQYCDFRKTTSWVQLDKQNALTIDRDNDLLLMLIRWSL